MQATTRGGGVGMSTYCAWATRRHALAAHGRQVFNLQYLHSKMCQCGPLWQIAQTHWMSVDSDLSRLNE